MTSEQAIVNAVLALGIWMGINMPFFSIFWLARIYIKKGIAGIDGVPDINEIERFAYIMALFLFVNIISFIIITEGALNWPYPKDTLYVPGALAAGAMGLTIWGIKKSKKNEQSQTN